MTGFIYGFLLASWGISGIALLVALYVLYRDTRKLHDYDELSVEERFYIKKAKDDEK